MADSEEAASSGPADEELQDEGVPGESEGLEGGDEAIDDGERGAEGEEGLGGDGGEPLPEGEGGEGEPLPEGEAGEPMEGTEGEGAAPEGDGEAGAEGEEGAAAAEEAPAEAEPAPPKRRGRQPPPEEPPLTEEELALVEEPDDDSPLPELYALAEDGRKVPYEGVESIFCTSTTLEMVGIQDLGKGEPKLLVKAVAKEVLLHDLQFRGAISDFNPIKARIQEADYDPILIGWNEDDWFGDGNNIMVATRRTAAEAWTSIDAVKDRRRRVKEAKERAKRIAKRQPKHKRQQQAKPWVDLGSAAEVELLQVRPQRAKLRCMAERKRSLFNREFNLSDRESHDLWNSSQMECRPFKDPNYDLRRVELEAGVQAVPDVIERASQASSLAPLNKAVQYEARDADPSDKASLLASKDMGRFLSRTLPQLERSLQQNEVINIFQDEIAALFDEEAIAGAKTENTITEYQSFTDLVYSKNKNVWAIEWVPGRRGAVAVSCTEALTFDSRVDESGRPSTSAVLIWNFADPIHPETVLEAPFEIFAFKFNPITPDVVAGGCYNGQVLLWDMRPGKGGKAGPDGGRVALAQHMLLSDVESSHGKCVTDLEWLPHIEITRDYRVHHLESGKECHFFVTGATDGCLLFWDARPENITKPRGRRDADGPLWLPIMRINIASELGGGLSCTRFNFNSKERPLPTKFFAGSNEGEVLYGEFGIEKNAQPGTSAENIISHCQAHCSPVVSLSRSPTFPYMLLSVGDWSFRVLREGHPQPVFTSPMAPTYYTAGTWSPSRPGVLYLARLDGVLEVWDLMERSHEPALTSTVSSTALRSMAFQLYVTAHNQSMAHHYLAIGDDAGVLHVLELPRNLRRPGGAEKKSMEAFWAREVARMQAALDRSAKRGGAGAGGEGGAEGGAAPAAAAAPAAPEGLPRATTAVSSAGLRTSSAGGTGLSTGGVDEKLEAEFRKLEAALMLELGLVKLPEKE